MFITDIKRVIDQVSREKGIEPEVLINTLKEAIISAARKNIGPRADIEVHYDERTGEVEVFHFKEVVAEVEYPDSELTIEEGYEYDPECEIGDSLGIRIDTEEFGRIAAQSAKQVIIQKMREAERNAVYENFIHKKGKIINGIVQRFDRGSLIVNLGQAEGVLRPRDQMPRENYKRGDRIRAYILDVLEESKGAQIILSRTHPEFLIELFKTEVPEVAEGIVTLRGAARVPGVRAKVAVSSMDSDVDPVGACVGMKGNRVQSIVQELRGEKIDIVQWNPDVARFVCNALSPAEISRVIIDEDNQSMEVIVSNEYLSIAIGKGGQNVSLACEITGWHLEVTSEEDYSRELKEGYDSLMQISGVGLSMAESLFKGGYASVLDISEAEVEDIMAITDLDETGAQKMIEEAKKILQKELKQQKKPVKKDSRSFEKDNAVREE
ncbi:MAG: transcription termination factor NusA [Proteobacteria bacterium]|nr:transcription termination factor NusA [Pseudomonadota bacterium]MBU1388298.1 transcription termination factor NusA [Pseudomonadota bacterium]MBU1542885.1 transcription termination factor NusA [Pseudomonadota bacterium]MBU2430261.1 transcription termination factor NusA [Pseudomonadota bacterium]MBU2480800.1 transcription termination factor NusA [Pseudomonadota bacterium]